MNGNITTIDLEDKNLKAKQAYLRELEGTNYNRAARRAAWARIRRAVRKGRL